MRAGQGEEGERELQGRDQECEAKEAAEVAPAATTLHVAEW